MRTYSDSAAYVERLNTHEGLYGQLVHSLDRYEAAAARQQSEQAGNSTADVHAQRRDSKTDEYSAEAVRVGRSLRHDFEKAGVHLPPQQRDHLTQLTGLERRLGMAIGEHQ